MTFLSAQNTIHILVLLKLKTKFNIYFYFEIFYKFKFLNYIKIISKKSKQFLYIFWYNLINFSENNEQN